MSLPWFRMYAEFATDAKVQSMDETLQRRFTMFLCLHCAGEFDRLSDDELAFALRITTEQLATTKEVFRQKGFLDPDGKIRNWNKRQFKSDSSTERVREHRQRHRNGDETLQERPQIQIQIQKQSQKEKEVRPRAHVRAESEPPEFCEIRQSYPKRANGQRWGDALKAFRRHVTQGTKPEDILAGVKRYALHIRAAGKEGTQYVLQAATFLGDNKCFLEPWPPPVIEKVLSPVERVLLANGANGVNRDERVVAEQFGSFNDGLGDLGGDVRNPPYSGFRRIGS
jgi:hypothetical protein